MAVKFDGVDDYITCGDISSLEGLTAFSVGVWEKWLGTVSTTGSSKTLIRKQSGGTCWALVVGVTSPFNRGRLWINIAGSWYNSGDGTTDVADGNWHLVVGTWDGSNIRIYADAGAAENSTVQSGTMSSDASTVSIGTYLATGEPWNGLMTDIFAYNVGLTQAEIEQIYYARLKGMPLQIRPANLKTYWPLDNVSHAVSGDAAIFPDRVGGWNGTGIDGANNTGLTGEAETYLSYPNKSIVIISTAAVTPQFARPDADTTVGVWTNEAAATTNLFASINEVTANDTTFVQSDTSATSGEIYQTTLSNVTDPLTSSNHILRWRYAKSSSAGRTIAITLYLLQGASLIISRTFTNIGSTYVQDNYILTAAEANSITDYSDLNIRLSAFQSGSGGSRTGRVSWIEFQVPQTTLVQVQSDSIFPIQIMQKISTDVSLPIQIEERVITVNTTFPIQILEQTQSNQTLPIEILEKLTSDYLLPIQVLGIDVVSNVTLPIQILESIQSTGSLPIQILEKTISQSTFPVAILTKTISEETFPIEIQSQTIINVILPIQIISQTQQVITDITLPIQILEKIISDHSMPVEILKSVSSEHTFPIEILIKPIAEVNLAVQILQKVISNLTIPFSVDLKVTSSATFPIEILSKIQTDVTLPMQNLLKVISDHTFPIMIGLAVIEVILDKPGLRGASLKTASLTDMTLKGAALTDVTLKTAQLANPTLT